MALSLACGACLEENFTARLDLDFDPFVRAEASVLDTGGYADPKVPAFLAGCFLADLGGMIGSIVTPCTQFEPQGGRASNSADLWLGG